MLRPDEAYWWLKLLSVPGVGPVRYRSLISRFGGPEQVFQASREELTGAAGIDLKTAAAIVSGGNEPWVAEQLAALKRVGAFILALGQSDFPASLAKIEGCPPLLFARGNYSLNAKPAVAVVGSRLATYYGKKTAEDLSAQLARQGLAVVSGLARGIDSAAHRGALLAGGPTVAVLGCGVDVVYPPENRRLQDEIAEKGLVVSEYPMGAEPLAGHFPNRNRIITGLSLGVVAVEARGDSGVFSSVRWAADQGREVFAVPGPINSAASFGTNRLIKQGAKLVQGVEDIIEELRPYLTSRKREKEKQPRPDLAKEEEPIFELLSEQPLHVDSLAQQAQRSINEVLRVLFDLEMKGLVKQLPGKMYIRM